MQAIISAGKATGYNKQQQGDLSLLWDLTYYSFFFIKKKRLKCYRLQSLHVLICHFWALIEPNGERENFHY